MTHGNPDTRPFVRIVLALIVAADLLSFFFFLSEARANALADGVTLNLFNDLLSRSIVRGVVVAIGTAGAVAFGRKPGRLWEGTLALGALILLSTAHAQLFGSPWRHLFYSGLCLSGWLLGLAISRRQGRPTDESFAHIGSIALLGAAYFNAGISKLVYGGFAWTSGTPIQAVIIGQDGLVADGILSMYRSWVVSKPDVARFFSIATMVFELAAPLMVFGRRTRLCVALGLVAMHANIYVLTDILYGESMVFLLLFGFSPDTPSWAMGTEAPRPNFLQARPFVRSAVFLGVCAFLAIVHQGRRADVQATASFASAPQTPAAAALPTPSWTPDAP